MNPIQKQLLVYGAAVTLAMVSGGVVNSSPVTDGGITIASGTGFFVTDDGYLISNNHVVKDAVRVCLRTSAGLIDAKVVQVDADNDLALLKAEGKFSPLPIVASGAVKLGGTVATVGFPNIEMQGFSPKLTKGEISSLNGVQDDPRYFQISVPVQPGNSGSALVDAHGNVVGIVSAKLNVAAALAVSGELPENVNYAVKSSLLLKFLESVPDVANKLKAPVTADRKFEDVVKSAQDAAVLVLVVGKGRESNITQENPSGRVASSNTQDDVETQAAAQFEKDFYEKYPDLKPYGKVCDAVALKVKESGYRGESREAIMEMFANAAREELGRRFEQGDGVTKDYVEAAKWYQKAAEQNYAPAQYNLGAMYQNGGGVTQDVIEAFKWFYLAAAQGNADAATNRDNLAGALTPNQETESSWRIALFQIRFKNAASPADIPTLKRSAEQGDGQAQTALGWLYCSGSAVPQNYAEAVNWWRKAADQGLATAQNRVGMMYFLGYGVPQSYSEAFKWFFKVAQQGKAVGQYNVGEAFEYGLGVPHDDVAAYTWYSLAALQGYSDAIIRRDKLSPRLRQEQIAEALRHVCSFKPAIQSSP